MPADEWEDGGGAGLDVGGELADETGDKMASSSSGLAMRSPPKAPLSDRSPLMFGSSMLLRQRLWYSWTFGTSDGRHILGSERAAVGEGATVAVNGAGRRRSFQLPGER